MATATKKNYPAPSPPPQRAEHTHKRSLLGHFIDAIDAIYRFLASVKLAVLTLGALVVTLAYATVFDSEYGSGAAAEYIYRSAGFAILLAFLGINILCAALIRYPWKKRQTGFVITHIGLLIMLAGSYYSVRTSDEGQVGMLEGDLKGELVRTSFPVIRVWEVDPHTRQYLREVDLPFAPGSFPWGPGKPQSRGVSDRLLSLVTLGLAGGGKTEELLTKPGDAFQLVVKEHLPASAPAREHITDPTGSPMARIRLLFKPPGMSEEQDAFPSEDDQWFTTEKKFYRAARAPMRGAPALVTFAAVDRPELVEDFLKPPTSGKSGVARFRYPDKAGHTRVFDWALEGQQGKSVPLPESNLKVGLKEIIQMPTQEGGLARVLGDDPLAIAVFEITPEGGEPVSHMALANLPMVPNIMPSRDNPTAPPKPALASIHYMVAPVLDPRTNGRFGQIDILAGPDHTLSYRVFGRSKDSQSEMRGVGTVSKRQPILAFGGAPNMPMKISFTVEDYLPSGIERDIFVPVVLPKGKKDEGIGACLVAMTVGKETKDLWLRRSLTLDPPSPSFVTFGETVYAVAYDVDRKPLGFELKLDDFDVGFEPGTEQATKFVSKVKLTDKTEGIKDQPHTISMNHPLYHQGYTFYQSRYQPDLDPQTERPTGRFQSIFQVAINPGRPIIYSGCLLVVLGAFVQFYMRAGLFTDGGKKERERAATKALALATKTSDGALPQEEQPPAPSEDLERL